MVKYPLDKDNFDGFIKSLILLAPQAILGFMTQIARTRANALKQLAIFNARLIMNLFPKLLDVAHKRLFTKPPILRSENSLWVLET